MFAVGLLALIALVLPPTASLSASDSLSNSNLAPSFPGGRAAASAPAPSGRLILSAENAGTWNLYAADPNGGAWQPLAVNSAPAREPAVSPDGRSIAYRARRDGFWDIYAEPAGGGPATRLTRGMIYSGAPVWSPDATKIAFESYARGDLDIWVMNADGSGPVNLTPDSRYQDYAPAWSPDGKWIAFTSWRTGLQQIMIVPADCTSACKATNLSQNKFDDEEPAWSPDGSRIAFVSDRDGQRAIYTAGFSGSSLKNIKRITFSGWDDRPAWSPDGNWIAFVSARPTRQPVYVVSAQGGIPHIVDDGDIYASSVTWTTFSPMGGTSSVISTKSSTVAASPSGDGSGTPLFQARPDVAAAGSGHPYEMRRMTSTRLDPGINKLNGLVADSFVALQNRLKQELGYDYLAVLADMARPVDYTCDVTCDTLSWHKAGRAFDARLDYTDARGSALEIVREDQQGETFWRMFLRTSAQDGSMGEPMKQAPWDLSYRARWVVDPGEGGTKKPVPYGFYVDVTELAREYGWERISSNDDIDFSWRTNKIAAEYWHYQNLEGLNWYQAMRQVFADADIGSVAEWNSLVTKGGFDAYLLYYKGIPAPAKAWQWYVLGP